MARAGRGSLLLASLLASLVRLAVTFSAVQPDTHEEWGPIIAVLAQPLGNATDYLPASYVKWLELGGARVVPVMYEATDREVDAIFANTNGLLLIGGDAPVCSAACRFLASAVSAAKGGDAYPIWGTCDGFEWLMQMAAKDDGALQPGFDSENLPLPLELTAAAAGRLPLPLAYPHPYRHPYHYPYPYPYRNPYPYRERRRRQSAAGSHSP